MNVFRYSSALSMFLAFCVSILSFSSVAGKRHSYLLPNVTDTAERRLEGDGILCASVQEIDVLEEVDGKSVMTDIVLCRLHPQHTNGVSGMTAKLEGVDVSGYEDAVSQFGQGVTLFVVDGILSADYASLTAPEGVNSLEWTNPSLPDADGRRRLDVAARATGAKSVLIIRISVTGMNGASNHNNEGPVDSTLIDEVFGLSGDSVNLATQYDACSYGRISMVPAADGPYPNDNGYTITNGIVNVNVGTVDNSPFSLSNMAIAMLGGDSDEFDVIMYSLPWGSSLGTNINWLAFAYQPGRESWYNHKWILYPSVQLHEVGHSFGLAHSNTVSTEYADTTGVMGYADSIDDSRKCFNGAKMVQLGWYNGDADPTMDRIRTVKPLAGSWQGKVIGVADYGNSREEHALVVLIEHVELDLTYFLTYNRAKGINADTGRNIDELTISTAQARGIPGEWSASTIVDGLDVGQSYQISNFGAQVDETVVITVVGSSTDVGLDGTVSVDYLDVTIELMEDSCSVDTDCKTKSCATSTCVASVCQYTLQEECCGNKVCERFDGETCGSCPEDCFGIEECPVIHGENVYDIVGYTNGNPVGFMFDVDAHSDIWLYELGIYILQNDDPNFDTITGEIYSRSGTHVGKETRRNKWNKVGDASVVGAATGVAYSNGVDDLPVRLYSIPLTQEIFMEAGEKRSFYVTSTTNWAQYIIFGGDGTSVTTPTQLNSDLTVYEGRLLTYDFILRPTVRRWKGTVGYYHETQAPTSSPSMSISPSVSPSTTPSVSSEPSASPSSSPSMSISPSVSPSATPSASSEPSASPSSSPSMSISPSVSPSATPSASSEPSASPSAQPRNAGSSEEHSAGMSMMDMNNEEGTAHGDPHFKTWTGERYDFHGICDLVLLQNPEFEDELGMDVHIRSKQTKKWSFISNAVLRIGEETLEVEGSSKQGKGCQYWINGVQAGSLKNGISGFSVVHTKPSSTQQEFEIILDHHSSITMKTFKDFVRIDVKGSSENFRGSRGLMGLYGSGARLGREGEEVIEDLNAFGQEWQVLPSEDMLFHNTEGPQAPMQCVLPDISSSRRRLEELALTVEDAEIACSRVIEADFDACVFDVLATDDKEMAGAY